MLDGSAEVKLYGAVLVGIPAIECITLCRQFSGVFGGFVIRNILAGGCVAVLGDKAYFVILGCPLGVNRGVALDGLGKVKLFGAGIVGIPAIECKALYRGNGELVGVDGFAMFNRLVRKRTVVGYEFDRVLALFPLGVNRGIARDGLGKVKLCGVGSVGIPAIECITLYSGSGELADFRDAGRDGHTGNGGVIFQCIFPDFCDSPTVDCAGEDDGAFLASVLCNGNCFWEMVRKIILDENKLCRIIVRDKAGTRVS